ncbi:MAG: hypothetical protein ACREDJ_00195, partial [Methylocella sp.]
MPTLPNAVAALTQTQVPFSFKFKTRAIRKMALAAPGVAEGLKTRHSSWRAIRIIVCAMFSINLNAICFDFARQSHIARFTPANNAKVLHISNLYSKTITVPLPERRARAMLLRRYPESRLRLRIGPLRLSVSRRRHQETATDKLDLLSASGIS